MSLHDIPILRYTNPCTTARNIFFTIVLAFGFSGYTNAHSTCGGKGHDPITEVPKEIADIISSREMFDSSRRTIRSAPPKPSIVSRTSWGCSDGQSSPLWPPQYTAVTHIVVHHSATTNTSSNWKNVVSGIFSDHRNTQKWGDIGYNYLIDPNGVIYEGRAGGDNVIGAHFSCMNGGTMGVCLLGTFDSSSPTQAAINSLNSIIAWKCSQRGINPTGSSFHDNSKLTLNNISGHRDGNSASTGCPKGTVCPGAKLYAKMPEIRTAVSSLIDSGTITPPSVRTDAASSITSTSAVLNGTIVNNGGASVDTRQFGWGNDPVTHTGAITNSSISVSGNSFSATLSGLQPNTTYYFSAWAKNASNTNWGPGEILSFKTASNATPPSRPISPSPQNGASGESLNQTLTWSNGGGATSYDVYFGTDSTPDTGELEGTQTQSQFNPPTLAYSTTYYWRIDGRNSNGVTTGNVWSFTTGSAPATKVILLSGIMDFGTVAVGSTAGATLRITNNGNTALAVSAISYPSGFSGNWSSGSISANGGFKDVAVTFSPIVTSNYGGTITVSSDKSSGTNTIDCTGTGVSVALPSKPTNPNPINGASGESLNQTLTWSNGGGATSYDVYFGTDSTPDTGELKGTQTQSQFNPPTLAYSTTYYWRIDGRNSNGVTTGNVWSFTTGSAPATKVILLSGIMDFGTVAVGSTAGATLRITNNGNTALAVSAISYPSGFSGNWSSGSISANGGFKDVAVTFSPTVASSYGGTITVSSDKTSGSDGIACSGKGIPVISQTNLRPYRPSGWSSPLVITRYADGIVQSEGLVATEELFLNWAVENNGSKNIQGSFHTKVLIDNQEIKWGSNDLKVGYYTHVDNWSIGRLSVGTHRITLITDSENEVDELNEHDNRFELLVEVRERPRPEINVTLSNSDHLKSGSAINFGNLKIGKRRTKEIIIWNHGSKILNLSKLRIEKNSMLNYSFTGARHALVHPDNGVVIKVTFSPRSRISGQSILRIYNNDSDEGIYTLKLRGSGL